MSDHATNTTAAEPAEPVYQLYRYTPSLPAALIVAIAFAVLSIWHFKKLFQNRTWYFVPFSVGGIFEILGYSGRVWSHFDKESLGGFIIQSLFILIAPALYAATIYMILARIIRVLGATHLALIRIQWLTKVFVIGDCLSFFIQSGGGGIQAAGSLELLHLGEKIILVGLFIQIIIFGFFIVSALNFHWRIRSSPTRESITNVVPWERHLLVLYGTSLIIMVRSVFRVMEYIQGNAGYIISNEYFLYIFDAVLMIIVMAVFLWKYVDDLAIGGRKGDMERLRGMEMQ